MSKKLIEMVKFNNKCVRDDDASVRAIDINKTHNRSKLKLKKSYIDTFDTKMHALRLVLAWTNGHHSICT